MAIMGCQIANNEKVICPFHHKEHDFTDNETLKYYSVIYLDRRLQGRRDFVTIFPPSLQ